MNTKAKKRAGMPIVPDELLADLKRFSDNSKRFQRAKAKRFGEVISHVVTAVLDSHPAIRKAKRLTQGRAPGPDPETRYLRKQRLDGETAKALWQRLRKRAATDEQPVYFVGDEMYISRNGKKITFTAFEKRLVGTKGTTKSRVAKNSRLP